MICGERRLDRRENIDLALAADLKNSSAAVAYIKIVFLVENDAGCNAHAFYIGNVASARGNLIHDPIVAARYVEHALRVERQPSGIHNLRNEWLRVQVRIDLID